MRWTLCVIAVAASLAGTAAADEPTCKSAYGKTACGFECVAAYGEVACARTPFGVCQAAYNQVACWDPPRFLRRGRGAPEKPSCTAAYGTIACGYHCIAAYNQVQCSRTPQGRCLAAYNQVVCGDPPRRLFRRARPAPVQCKAAYNRIACGYGCVAAYNDVKCSRTPAGRCTASQNQVVCWDPRRAR